MATRELTGLLSPLAASYALLWALTAGCAAAAAIPPLAAAARGELGLALAPHTANLGYAAAILVRNVLAGGWPALLPMLGAWKTPGGRLAARLTIGVWLAVNIAPVGVAIGAYGQRLIPYLPHLPLEWAALAIAAAPNTRRLRQHPPGPTAALALAAAFVALLAAGALVETYLTPHL